MKNPPTFCVLPWIHRFINVDGNLQVCCTSEEYETAILDDKGQPYNANSLKDYSQVQNSKHMKNIKQQMLSGEWPKICERCRLTEAHQGISRRQAENTKYQHLIESLIQNTDDQGNSNSEIRSFDFRLGNVCNLSCRMCSPRSSTRWFSDWNQFAGRQYDLTDEMKTEFQSYYWFKNSDFLQTMGEHLEFVEHLHFAGGEPLIIPQMIEILEKLILSGHSEKIELSYNTNMTVLPAKLLELWPYFKGTKIMASIDGFGEVNEYIRHHSKWKDIDRNLKFLEKNFDRLKLIRVHVMATIQVYNMPVIYQLYDYLRSEFRRVDQVPYLIDLYSPEFFRTQVLPQGMKSELTVKLTKMYQEIKEQIQEGKLSKWLVDPLETLLGAINFMNAEGRSADIGRLYVATLSMDSVRKQHLASLEQIWSASRINTDLIV